MMMMMIARPLCASCASCMILSKLFHDFHPVSSVIVREYLRVHGTAALQLLTLIGQSRGVYPSPRSFLHTRSKYDSNFDILPVNAEAILNLNKYQYFRIGERYLHQIWWTDALRPCGADRNRKLIHVTSSRFQPVCIRLLYRRIHTAVRTYFRRM